MFNEAEKSHYSRHFLLPEVGLAGQQKLKESSVLCIGSGGLGSPVLLYLAAAGVGKIGIVDEDFVEKSNLQRQILHGESFVGKSKAESAKHRLREVNPHIQLEMFETYFSVDNAMQIAESFDIIVDGSDNFETRYLSNDVAFMLKIPNVYASIYKFEGQVSVFAPHLGGPCYRCMLPSPPDPASAPT
jgi:adenylyltransferase/sulfurtransferase